MQEIMKKFTLTLVASLMAMSVAAHILTITLADGTERVITTSELKSITFGENNEITAVTYNDSTVEGINNIQARRIEMNDKAKITEIISRQMHYEYSGISLGTRDVKCVNYVYPSVDPSGNPISLSGVIIIPDNIYDGTDESNGVLLYNHYTLGDKKEAPTLGVFSCETVLLGNFLKPNYIMVESDFYGFGATERYPQAYLYGQTNAKASVDAYNAALEILEDLNVNPGKYLFNIGYSSGGFDVMAVQKEVDNNHRGEIKIDKTYGGGGPCDLPVVYRSYVEEDSIKYLCAVPLMLCSYNESAKLGLDYHDVFQNPLADNIYDWVIDMNYNTWEINGMIGEGTLVSQMLQPIYCDFESQESKEMMEMMRVRSNNIDWEPDPNDKFFLLHSRDDEYVTFGAARSLADYLTSKGFVKSIIPGRTNFQTNLVLKKMGHIAAMVVFLVQVSADIAAWPIIHATPETEAEFERLVSQELTVAQVLDYFNDRGYNANDIIYLVRKYLINGGEDPGTEGGDIDIAELLAALGINPAELAEMCDDSGVNLNKVLFDLLIWLRTHPGTLPNDGDAAGAIRQTAGQETPETNIIRVYEKQLMDHYRDAGVFN